MSNKQCHIRAAFLVELFLKAHGNMTLLSNLELEISSHIDFEQLHVLIKNRGH